MKIESERPIFRGVASVSSNKDCTVLIWYNYNCNKTIKRLHRSFTQIFSLFVIMAIMEKNNDGVEINGVELSQAVLEAMRAHDFKPENYPAGVLREVVSAMADGKLIEDENGAHLLDKLKLTYDEKRKQEAELEGSCEDEERPVGKWAKCCAKKKTPSYRDKIEAEKEHGKHHEHCHA